LSVPLGVCGNFQHPLPTIDDLRSAAKAVRTQIVLRGFDVFDHDRA